MEDAPSQEVTKREVAGARPPGGPASDAERAALAAATPPTASASTPTPPGADPDRARDGADFGPLRQKIGRFTIIGELGRGGYGIVYRAIDPTLGRAIALKLLRDELARPRDRDDAPGSPGAGGEASAAADAPSRERLLREARAVARLGKHPHVIQVHEAGETAEGDLFIAMELVEGESLERLAARGPLPWRDAAAIGRKVALGLEHAHRHGLVHRDVKPSNVILDRAGEPQITDFGVAKDLESGSASITRTGSAVGTPAFMSPEQAQGLPVDARADVYGVGALLHALIRGRAPFAAPHVAMVLAQVIDVPPPRLRGLHARCPRDLETIVLKAMEKDPAARYASASDFAADLARVLDGEPCSARRPGPLELAVRHFRRRPRNLVLVMALCAAAFITARYRQADRERAELEAEDVVRLRLTQVASLGHAESRLEAIEQVLSDHPESWQAHYERGLAEREIALSDAAVPTAAAEARERFDEAEASFTRALERNAAADVARFWRGIVRCEALARPAEGERDLAAVAAGAAGVLTDVARALVATGTADADVEALAAAIDHHPDLGLLRERRGRALLQRSIDPDDLERALVDLDAAVRLEPLSARAHLLRASALQPPGRFDEALAEGDRAVALSPAFVDAYEVRASVRLTRGDAAGALADVDRALALRPEGDPARAGDLEMREAIASGRALAPEAPTRSAAPGPPPPGR